MSVHRHYVCGEIDCASSAILRKDLDALVSDIAITDIVLDCRELTFIDSAGCRLLMQTQLALAETGRHLRLEGLSQAMRRMFDTTGLTGALRVTSEP